MLYDTDHFLNNIVFDSDYFILVSSFVFMKDEWLECQRNWLYLESIFSAPDIQRQLPKEAKMFIDVDKSWKTIMRRVQKNPLAIRAGTHPGTHVHTMYNLM